MPLRERRAGLRTLLLTVALPLLARPGVALPLLLTPLPARILPRILLLLLLLRQRKL